MSETFNLTKARHEVEAARSAVRRRVTYWVVMAYLLMAGVALLWLMYLGRHEIALGVLAGVSGLTGSIVGFWFGTRKPDEQEKKALPEENEPTEVGEPIKISGPKICHLVESIPIQALKDLKATPEKRHPIRAKLPETDRTLIGTVTIVAEKLTFNFEKVQVRNVVSPLTKPLVGVTSVPATGEPFDVTREILLA